LNGIILIYSFLGYIDHKGVSFEGDTIATGYGAYIAIPLLRKYWKADMNYQEAKDLLDGCLRVLFYRDARALNRV
jgi:20S proteasome subunit beta 7